MIPMIDLLMVTISFLLITAVWTTMGRVNASAQASQFNIEDCQNSHKAVCECVP